MAADLKTLMSQDKKALAQSVHTMGGKLKRFAKTYGNPAKNMTEQVMDLATHAGGAAGVGWYIGKRRAGVDADPELSDDEKENALKWFGVDQDFAIAFLMSAAGMTGIGGKRYSPVLRGLGTGAMAYYVGSKAEQMAYDRASEV